MAAPKNNNKMSRRQWFAKLTPPSVKEMAEKAHPDAPQRQAAKQAAKEAEAAAQAMEDERQERRLVLARDGNVALASGNLQEAVTHFRAFVKEAPHEAPPRLCLGRCLYDLGQFIQARVEFQRAMDLTKDGPTHMRDHAILFLGLSFLRLGKGARAHATWKDWHPGMVPALAETLDPILPRLAAPETTGEEIASCIQQVEAAVAKTPWAHLPPLVPNPPTMTA